MLELDIAQAAGAGFATVARTTGVGFAAASCAGFA